jgi:hypothetical protein
MLRSRPQLLLTRGMVLSAAHRSRFHYNQFLLFPLPFCKTQKLSSRPKSALFADAAERPLYWLLLLLRNNPRFTDGPPNPQDGTPNSKDGPLTLK